MEEIVLLRMCRQFANFENDLYYVDNIDIKITLKYKDTKMSIVTIV